MPEGDSIHRAALRLQGLVGERVQVETPHPRAAALNLAPRLDGKRLERVEAVGKNLLLHFEGGVTLRSHLRMKGRWRVRPRGEVMRGAPWLILRSAELEASQWNGPVLELRGDVVRRLGPDILERPPDLEGMIARLRRAAELPLAEALQRQQLVAGIGNMWAAEALWESRLSPWLAVRSLSDEELASILDAAHRMMSAALVSARPPRRVYRRAGRPCRRCGTPIRSQGQGEANRRAYWCPTCQAISSP
ncbi:MAG: DNA glycosylase [Actinobacteria bacterium]|nr:DNA glycosylase [Actinomycetota bacterium]